MFSSLLAANALAVAFLSSGTAVDVSVTADDPIRGTRANVSCVNDIQTSSSAQSSVHVSDVCAHGGVLSGSTPTLPTAPSSSSTLVAGPECESGYQMARLWKSEDFGTDRRS